MTMACCYKESKMSLKAAFCHNKVNTEVSLRQKTRTEGIPNNPRIIPEVFLMYHNVSTIMAKKLGTLCTKHTVIRQVL